LPHMNDFRRHLFEQYCRPQVVQRLQAPHPDAVYERADGDPLRVRRGDELVKVPFRRLKGEAMSALVKVTVEVRSGAARFRVGVQAPSIQRGVSLVRRLHPAGDVKVIFPIDPMGFFVKDPAARVGSVEHGQPEPVAAA
jgi:hypothetical protein